MIKTTYNCVMKYLYIPDLVKHLQCEFTNKPYFFCLQNVVYDEKEILVQTFDASR